MYLKFFQPNSNNRTKKIFFINLIRKFISTAIQRLMSEATDNIRVEKAKMAHQERIGYATAVAGATGLGLLLGSEYPGTYATLLGAALTFIAIVSIITLSFLKRR
jgi:N-acetylmuramic acid 6-phosphate (MurNAc-6-P) etherase